MGCFKAENLITLRNDCCGVIYIVYIVEEESYMRRKRDNFR